MVPHKEIVVQMHCCWAYALFCAWISQQALWLFCCVQYADKRIL